MHSTEFEFFQRSIIFNFVFYLYSSAVYFEIITSWTYKELAVLMLLLKAIF